MAREYDEIAEWYPAWFGDGGGIIAEGVGVLLPATVLGAESSMLRADTDVVRVASLASAHRWWA